MNLFSMVKVDVKPDTFEKILEGFKKDGTHQDFPQKKVFKEEELSGREHSSFAFDLPALVVYDRDEDGESVHFGIVYALSHRIDRFCIQVMSKHSGHVISHLIEESPSAKKPKYLLLKQHNTMKSCL